MRYLGTFSAFSVLFIILACPASAEDDPISQAGIEEILTVLINDTSVRAYAIVELPGQRNVTVHEDHISLHLFGGQELLFNGVRSEITVDIPFEEHDTVIYQWEVMIPRGFQHDAPENRWWNMGQWHDQPDLTLGETWADFPGRSPSMSIHLKFYNGCFYFAPRYMHVEPPFEDLIEIQPGQWMKLSFEIRWSQSTDGYIKIRINDEQDYRVCYTGPNMHNGFRHFLKVGMYRHPDIDTDNTVNIRNLQLYHAERQTSIRSERTR